MANTIQTMHPIKSKQGVNINKEKYDVILNAILKVLYSKEEISFKELVQIIKTKLHRKFEGSITWYVTTVKLDLEGRKLIQRFSVKGIQHIKLAK